MKINFLYKFIKNISTNTVLNKSSFASAMAEGLEALKQQETHKPTRISYKSRYDGRAKKRHWENDNNLKKTIEEKRANFNPADRIKKKKSVVLLGYSGVNYFGMQRNPGQKTIEEDLLSAMLKNKWIDEEGYNHPQHIQFQRAARTDKGVSASRQICSVKLPEQLDLVALNNDLPDQIRVFGTKRVTKGFNAKDQCNARTYSYTLPTVAFAHYTDNPNYNNYRITPEQIQKLNEILKNFEGTKNFHNFTSRKEFLDPSAKRFIMSFECGQPFLSSDNIEFATIRIKGQSFMMHQIRKMIGLSLAVLRSVTTIDTIHKALTEDRLDIPKAPGLGLVLDQIHYERYNDRYGSDGIHEPLIWTVYEEQINEFTKKYIHSTILDTEFKEKSMILWLETLGYHSYDIRKPDDNPINLESNSNDEKGIELEENIRHNIELKIDSTEKENIL